MQIGMVGLGAMGGPMLTRLREHGVDAVGCDPSERARAEVEAVGAATAASVEELVGALAAPRTVWLMVPPGVITQDVVETLAELLAPGDLVVDGGNSDFRDAPRRAAALAERGIRFADVGVSGGQWGWKTGYGLTAGGAIEDIERIRPVLSALAAPDGHARVGDVGAGHLVKAVHNAVQYGVMQAYAEGFALLSAHDEVDVLPSMDVWQNGCSIRSFLLEQMIAALRENPGLDGVSSRVSDSGMGRWTAEEAIRLAVPTPVLSMALQARFSSRDDGASAKLLSVSRAQVGGQKS